MHRSVLPALKSGLARFYRRGSRPGAAKEQVSALTERRRIERRRWASDFRRRELRLDAAVQAAGLGTYDLDYRTGSNYWSSELKAIAGLPTEPGDVPLDDLERLLHPQDRKRVMEKISASLDPTGDGRLDDEYRLVRPDGSTRWVKVRGRTYFAENAHERRILGASGIVIDITERKAAERALREQSEELRLALRVGNSGTFQWDARTREHRWCDEMLVLYGLRREEFGGRDEDWLQCLLPEDREATMAAVDRSLATGEYAADFRIRRRSDGEIRWMSGRGQVYFDAEGAPLLMVGINVDISAFKLAEASREESRTRLAAVLDSLSEGVVIFDMEGQVLDMNPAARRMLRCKTAEEARRRLPEFTKTIDVRAMDDRSLPLEEWPIGRVIRSESFTEYDIIVYRKDDGSKRVISHNGHPVRGPGGEVILGVLTLLDVTERKRQARALQESERRLAVALAASGSAVWEMEVADGTVRGEDFLFTMLGYAPGELATLADWQSLIHEDDREGISEAVDEVVRGKRDSCRLEARIRAKDGSWRWILSQTAAAERDVLGKAVRLVGTHTDIGQRKQTEEALRRESSRLQGILNNAPALIWIRDMHGRVALANQAFFDTADVPPPENLLGRSIFDLFPEEMAKEIWANDQLALETDAPVRREERVRHKGGDWHTYLTITFPVSDVQTGNARGICSISMDITETKSAEEQIRRLNADLENRVRERTAELQRVNEALLASNVELKHFAHATAHDLQTPLRSIAGFAQLLQHETQELSNARIDAYAVKVIDNTKRLQSLIQEVLSYSRLETQGLPFEKVCLRGILDEVLASLDGLISETGSKISCGDLPALPVDRTQIAQVLQNLIENGIKYNHSKPPQISIGGELQGGEWVFSIADNGVGIDPRHHEKIFEIFRRLHTYHKVPGTGIGLALCRRIVERHGGRIWVESHAGQGSTFHFSLPAGKRAG